MNLLNPKNRQAIARWAREHQTTPEVVRAAIRRVGTSPLLVKCYLEQPKGRWTPDLFEPELLGITVESFNCDLEPRTPTLADTMR